MDLEGFEKKITNEHNLHLRKRLRKLRSLKTAVTGRNVE